MNIPLLRQLFVVSSSQLAAFSTGGAIGLPSVLLQHFKRNDTQIHVDLNTESWIASIHGIAGISSLFLPYLMQYWGRKFAFCTCCFSMFIGWTVMYFANSPLTVITAELFQGAGAKSLLVVNTMALSEMIGPRIRNQSISFYGITQTIAILCVHTAGRYIHWKTISLIMCFLSTLAILFSFVWPESPAWLAYKGRFEESKKSFIWLRGKDKESLTEMNALFTAQREFLNTKMSSKTLKRSKPLMRNIWQKIISRDFFLPTLHVVVLLSCHYWSGILVIIMYAVNLIEKVIENSESAFIGMIFIDVALTIGTITSTILLKYFGNKPILLISGVLATLFLLGASSTSYLQHINVIADDSLLGLCCLVGFMVFSSLGFYMIPFAVAGEIMPLRHRGLGGSLTIVFICSFYTVTLKIAPYLIIYLNIHGTFLLYAIILSCCLLLVWLYVPETKNKTLQSIEEYYIKNGTGTTVNIDEETNECINLNIKY